MLVELIVASVLLVSSIIYVCIAFRRVVPTNEAHIVQRKKTTMSYGKDTPNGNTYYEWPYWIPTIGVVKVALPVSVFDITLHNYEAYDKGRVPFVVDIVAFFRVSDSNISAQRVSSFQELKTQLTAIVQGAIRTVLASHEIDSIMLERSKFGEQFTKEVEGQLVNWGVVTVKNIELMDIRDSGQNQNVQNIMKKRESHIEMESRSEVAENMKKAKIAEINANRDTQTENQNALKIVGLKTAETEKEVGIAKQEAVQAIREQEKFTKEKEMAVVRVAEVTKADIVKNVEIVNAEQKKQTTVLIAEGNLEGKKRESEGIAIEGQARAEAEKAMQLAPIKAQIELAKEIGTNQNYQNYLVTIKQVEANQIVGVEQAKALDKADIKVIVNSGAPAEGLKNVMDIFSSKGGTQVGAMLEGLVQTEQGKAVVNKIIKNGELKETI